MTKEIKTEYHVAKIVNSFIDDNKRLVVDVKIYGMPVIQKKFNFMSEDNDKRMVSMIQFREYHQSMGVFGMVRDSKEIHNIPFLLMIRKEGKKIISMHPTNTIHKNKVPTETSSPPWGEGDHHYHTWKDDLNDIKNKLFFWKK